ncbi:amino acid adenylation domain-containing protein [Streptomyces sp. NPDC020362]|uniref:amino acid adenylation domain-containing protein n=1 Tax=unclassified Streptomyces TaxID=2593676 RepID=UPI00340DFA42
MRGSQTGTGTAARSGSRIEDVLPLTPLQEGLLFHALFDPSGTEVYNVQLTLTLSGGVDAGRLRGAVEALLRRHPNLRGSFRFGKSGVPAQVVPRAVSVPWTETDLREAGEDAYDRLLTADRVRPFDPAKGPLLRCTLVRTGEREHRLVLTHHHILLDGWSLAIAVRELFALYTGRQLPPAPPYRDYLAWLADRDAAAAEHAWRQALEGLAAGTFMAPPDPARGAVLPEAAECLLPTDVTTDLAALARRNGTTLNTVVQCAWGTLLRHATGQDDVVFGAIVAGRPPEIPAADQMVGLFINALPVRIRFNPAEPLSALLARVQREQAALTGHQHRSLAEVTRWSGLDRLFDTLVVFESYPVDRDGLKAGADDMLATSMSVEDATHYPLTLVVVPGERLRLRIAHRADLFPADTARDLVARLGQVLTRFAAAADAPVSAVRLLDPAEERRVVHDWNDTGHAVPNLCLPRLFEDQAARSAARTAVVFEGEQVTYGELNARANRLARRLVDHGVGPERLVGLALPRSVELVVAVLAVLKAGGAYLPLDPGQPAERLRLMTEESAPDVVLTLDGTTELPGGFPRIALRAEPSGTPDPGAGDDLGDRGLRPGHPAYVLYTSGSTGRPKGVVVPHEGIVNRLAWMQDAYRLTPEDRVLQKTPAGFDVSVWEFLWPLLQGATLVVARPDGHRDPAYLAALIAAERVTTVHFVPSMLRTFLDEPAAAACTSLTRVICSGEALPAELAARCLATLDAGLHNLYGPTEASVDVTAWRCDGGDTVPIGRPVWNTRTYVLDSALRPVPIGVTGELYLGGRQLARGYLAQPGRTAERFVADPYGPPGARLYRTGDLARLRHDGALEYAGRTDDQVKLRGQRIEPGEVAAVLERHPAVRHAEVVLRENRLVGYVVPAPGEDTDPQALRKHTAAHLPDAMVPSAVVVLDRLPLTPNGKLDRRALPAPAPPSTDPAGAPRSPREEVLCGLFADILGLDRIGVHDDFFDLGGHSLLAARLIGRVREVLGVETGIRTLFTAPTVAAFAERLGEAPGGGLDVVLPLRPTGRRAPLFCVHPAAGLGWCYSGLLRHLGREHPVYALQSRGLDGASGTPVPGATLEDIADDYAAQIRQVQPHGPVHLLGWSFGGVLAHRLATRLQSRGEEVALLAILDAYPRFDGARDYTPDTHAVLTGLLHYAGHTWDRTEPLTVPAARAVLERGGSALATLDERQLALAVEVFRRNFLAQQNFAPEVFDGDLLFVAATGGRGADWPTAGDWQPYVTGAIRRHQVDVDHGLMLTDPGALAAIGRCVSDRLRDLAHRARAHPTPNLTENPAQNPTGKETER